MVNEVIQWSLLILLGFMVLGTVRQVSLMIPSTTREVRASRSGGRLPHRMLDRLRNALPGAQLSDPTIVAFITENCVGCQELLADVPRAAQRLNGTKLLLVPKSPTTPFQQALSELGFPVLVDDDDRLWKAINVTATPLVVAISREGRILRREVTHRVDVVAPGS